MESVWVDSLGRLHMKIRQINGVWHSAEVVTNEFTKYGEHRFFVEGKIDEMDRNAVLGLFVYFDDQNEIDIEYTKWGIRGRLDLGHYTVQPYTTPGNTIDFPASLDTTLSTHFFDWQPDSIVFGSIQGLHEGAPPSPEQYIWQWTYTGNDIPDPRRNLRTHINLWMFRGASPEDTSNLEVIITDVFQPLSPVTSVQEPPPGKPETFILDQNYPNPFNPQTTIRYELTEDSAVSLKIYNLLAQEVRTLVNEVQPRGTKTVVWNGKDDSGRVLASGVYVYELRTGKYLATKRMLFLQ